MQKFISTVFMSTAFNKQTRVLEQHASAELLGLHTHYIRYIRTYGSARHFIPRLARWRGRGTTNFCHRNDILTYCGCVRPPSSVISRITTAAKSHINWV